MKSNELAHHGVLGMKWGVRKRKPPSSTGSKSSTSSNQKKRLSEMSNEEIQKVNTRLSLEKKYKELTAKPTTTSGQIKNYLIDSSMKAVKSATDKQISNFVNKGFDAIFDPKTGKMKEPVKKKAKKVMADVVNNSDPETPILSNLPAIIYN